MVDSLMYSSPLQIRMEELQVALAHLSSGQALERCALRAREWIYRNDFDALVGGTRENDARASMMASDLHHATAGRQGSRALVQEPSLLHRQPAIDSLYRGNRILEAPASQVTGCLLLEIHAPPDTTVRHRQWEPQGIARCRS